MTESAPPNSPAESRAVLWQACQWAQGDVFCHCVLELLNNTRYPALEVLQPGLMVLHTDERAFVLLEYASAREAQIAGIVAELVGKPGPELQIGLIGGDEQAQALLERARPARSSLKILHLPDSERASASQPTLVLGRGKSQLRTALENAAARRGRAIDADTARHSVEAAESRFRKQVQERLAFSRLLDQRRPLATYSILGLILACFLLEWQLDATSSSERLLAMGALYRPLVESGEWWRMASSSLLHGGVMHVAFNAYVLFALGGLIERLLGTQRFLVLYVLSALGAAAGSLALSGSVSVGASGAIWGLLGALAALAFGDSQLFPPSVRRSIQRATLVNLGINTLASFLPFIDWAAHFAGGAAGAALVFSKLCLPPKGPSAPRGGWTIAAGVASAVFFGAGMGGVLGLFS